MKATAEKFITSYKTTIVLFIIYAIGMAFATFIEKYAGTVMAKVFVYYSPVFFLLQLLLVANFIAVLIKHQLLKTKKWGMIITHFSFIVILLGALTSHVFGEEGILHIREGETANRMVVQTSKETNYRTLPFSVELTKFTLTRYPGSSSPSSYESKVRIHADGKTTEARIFMNNILDVKGYRLFQASFDKDEQGTVLSVNKDVAGRNITYTGYTLLVIGFILGFIGKNSRFRTLNRRLKELRNTGITTVILLALASAQLIQAKPDGSSMMETIQKLPINIEHAAAFGALPIQSHSGRMMPVNTFSSEILRKLHKSDKIGSLNSDQFLLSLLALPEMWIHVPFITMQNKDMAFQFDISEKECSYAELFDSNGNYKLEEKLQEVYNKMPAERNKFDKDVMKLDEQINIIHQLISYQMLNLFPLENDPDHTWYAPGDDLSAFSGKDSMFVSRIMTWYVAEVHVGMKDGDWSKANEVLGMIKTYQEAKNNTLDIDPKKLDAELKYNKLNIFNQCKKGYLILGGLLLVLAFWAIFEKRKWITWCTWILDALVLICFHYHMFGMSMRWYIGGYAPWSNSYETMVYVSWATIMAGLLFMRRNTLTFALATLFGGIILFVSGLNWMDPQINTLVPVLKSPWLMIHVAVIVAAYGFFGISTLIGLTNLVTLSIPLKKKKEMLLTRVKELSIINEMSLLIGLALMTIGTFLGAVWANESWGRYWGWDPKETWALITVVVYAIVIHLRLVKKWDNVWLFNLTSVIAFASVLMTYFGVNYFLSGMHSYGQNDHINGIFLYLYIAVAIVAVLGFVSYRGWKNKNLV